MFSVFLYQIAYACDNLQQVARKQNNEIMDIEEIIGALGSLSGMDDVIGSLNGKKRDLEQQQQSLLSMLQGLRKIENCYRKAEERICDRGEGNGRASLHWTLDTIEVAPPGFHELPSPVAIVTLPDQEDTDPGIFRAVGTGQNIDKEDEP